MMDRPWYKRYPSDFIAGTISLTLEEAGAYSYIIDLIHDRGGPIPDDPQWIARVCGCSTRKWNSIREKLIQAGKINEKDGLISSKRAEKDAINGAKEARKLSESGAKGAFKTNEKEEVTNENIELTEKGPEKRERHTRGQRLEKEVNAKSVYKENAPSAVDLTIPISLDRTEIGEAVRLWNNAAERLGLAQMQKLTASRRAKLKARLKDCAGIDGWAAALEKLAGIPGLIGVNGGWKADFDFLVAESKFTKLMEGSYDGWTGEVSGKSDGFVAVAEGLA